jgi:purine-binding chemotaxis protein CheW
VSASRSETESILRERARALAQELTPRSERATSGEALVVRLGRARYAVPLEGLGGVVALDAITPLPGAPSFVSGLAQVHGHVLTIVDLGVVLGEGPNPPSAALLIDVKSESFGLGVSAYENVVSLPASGLAPAPPGLSDAASRYVEGLITSRGIGVLRLALLVSDLLREESGDGDGEQ